jgi:hypothetical protein
VPKKRFEEIKFKASLPNIQSAIQTHGGGDGYMVKLLVPQSEQLSVMKLGVCTNRRLNVIVKVELDGDESPGEEETYI